MPQIRYATIVIGVLALGWPNLSQAADPPTTKYDGVYVGSKYQTSGRGCSPGGGGEATARVINGVFMWGTPPTVSPISISNAGVIDGTTGTATVKGTATASVLEFDTSFGSCFNRWRLTKK